MDESETNQNRTKTPQTHGSDEHRSVFDRALDVAIGGTSMAADKAIDAVERTADRAGERLREARERVREAAEDTRDRFEDEDHRRYEDRTKAELYRLAAERDIASRSTMRKAELIDALRSAR